MFELSTQLVRLRSRHFLFVSRQHWAIGLAVLCGGAIGGLAALLVNERLLSHMAASCQLPASIHGPWENCRLVATETAIAPATGNPLVTTTSLMTTRWYPQQESEGTSPITLSPPVDPPEPAPVEYPFQSPPFSDSARLQAIVARLAAIAQISEYPVDALSISLVDLKTGEYAGVRDRTPRYPASVIKPFWAVAAIAYGETGPDIEAAITDSNNEASNRLLNGVGHLKMRDYWQAAGFSISAEYPVNVWVAGRPGNIVTTVDLVRLLHDVASPGGHPRIAQAMWHDVDGERHDAVGAVHGFLGGGLPSGSLLTKVGLTSGVRSEMSILTIDDQAYAIAIIGADRTYAQSESIFPAFGDLLFQLLSQ